MKPTGAYGALAAATAFFRQSLVIRLAILLMAAAPAACGGNASEPDASSDTVRATGEAGSDESSRPSGRETEDTSKEGGGGSARFASVRAGFDYTCGVRSDGSVACWGDNYDGQATPPGGSSHP